MMRPLCATALLVFLPSCDLFSQLDDVSFPVDKPQQIAAAIPGALAAGDLNGDGEVRGASELIALVNALWAAVQAALEEASDAD